MLTIMGFIDGQVKNWTILANEEKLRNKEMSSTRILKELKPNLNRLKPNQTLVGFSDSCLVVKKLNWKKYHKVETLDLFCEKIMFIQAFWKNKYQNIQK